MDKDERNRLKLTAAMQELLNRIQRGSLDPRPEVRPERPRRKFGVIQGGKTLGIAATVVGAARYLREHGTAAGTAAAIAAGAAVVYGITSGSDRPTVGPDIGAAPTASVHLTRAPVSSPAASVEPMPSATGTSATPMPAPVIAAPSTTAETTSPIGTPLPTPTSVPVPDPSLTGLPATTAWPTTSADPTPTSAPAATAPPSTLEPTAAPSATPLPGADEPLDQAPRLCLRIQPILRLCVGR